MWRVKWLLHLYVNEISLNQFSHGLSFIIHFTRESESHLSLVIKVIDEGREKNSLVKLRFKYGSQTKQKSLFQTGWLCKTKLKLLQFCHERFLNWFTLIKVNKKVMSGARWTSYGSVSSRQVSIRNMNKYKS